MSKQQAYLHLLGAGCASLSLCHYLRHKQIDTALYGQRSPAMDKAHFWGFWAFDWLDDAAMLATHRWKEWQFIDHHQTITHYSDHHPYHALDSSIWLSHCTSTSDKIYEQLPSADTEGLVLDSRPPVPPEGALIQHFTGQIIETPDACFNPEQAILMDFRCDQSRGIHFIYLLPFSAHRALVESTFFSCEIHSQTIYLDAIAGYMREQLHQTEYQVLHTETGQIPMAECAPHDANFLRIGANGGCLRASSGYAFSYIQKQVRHLAMMISAGEKITHQHQIKNPIRTWDRWMDRVFLHVLRHHPDKAPQLFMRLAQALTGDEFASFMSGQAELKTYAKLILSMPKLLFIRAALNASWGAR